MVNYDYREDDVRSLFDIEALARLVIEQEGMPDTTEVSIGFVDDEAIHKLNREWRGIDRPTDVLSFECDYLDDDMPVFDGGPFELGDVVVAPDIAESQAPQFGISFADEISLLVTHGLLHLCGYDHMDDEEARVMENRERELLELFWCRPFNRCGDDAQ